MTVKAKDKVMNPKTVKGSQFLRPLLEFNGACPGCGETPYIRLLTQLFGDRMMIANATGCSSIWGASAPSIAYTTDEAGRGPAWANSLFEDNAEYGYGMYLGVRQIREKLADLMNEALKTDLPEEVKNAFRKWLDAKEDGEASKVASQAVLDVIKDKWKKNSILKEIMDKKDFLVKRSFWIIGGDGWAYDIGYGGVDHVLAMGDDVNLFVMDTEIYSNTGGQASKATPASAVAKFAAAGKNAQKGSGNDGHELWICLCCSDFNGCRYEPDHPCHYRGRKLPGSIADYCLFTLCQPWHQEGNGQQHPGGKAGGRFRILASLQIQPFLREQGRTPSSLTQGT